MSDLSKSLTKNFQGNPSHEEVIDKLRSIEGHHSIAVGLSGGVDSSLTAALLVEAEWEVEGVTLWLMKGQGSCCSDGLVDAASICEHLKIPHHIIDSRETFTEEIVNGLIDGYKNGVTPSPCSKCNRSVKFSEMINWVKKNTNVGRIATGHYARIEYSDTSYKSPEKSKTRHKLLRGKDKNKDQSYFLYDLSQEVLGRIVFPLGELTKSQTREQALLYGLKTAKKPESQDLCLSEHFGSMKAFLDNYLPPREGKILLKDGTIVGNHDGIEHFTIGQRKGLGVSWHVPLHVIKLDPALNQVIVGPRSEAGKSSCIVGEINWVSINPPTNKINIEVQLRYRSAPINAELIPLEATESDIKSNRPYRVELLFKEEQFSITPGQAAVFYSGDVLLGGGLIVKN